MSPAFVAETGRENRAPWAPGALVTA